MPSVSHGQGRLAGRSAPSNSERPFRSGGPEESNKEIVKSQMFRKGNDGTLDPNFFVPPARPGYIPRGPCGPPEPGTGPLAGTTRSRTHSSPRFLTLSARQNAGRSAAAKNTIYPTRLSPLSPAGPEAPTTGTVRSPTTAVPAVSGGKVAVVAVTAVTVP